MPPPPPPPLFFPPPLLLPPLLDCDGWCDGTDGVTVCGVTGVLLWYEGIDEPDDPEDEPDEPAEETPADDWEGADCVAVDVL